MQRAGFDASRILTVQGDMAFSQCLRPCAPESVFETRPLVDALLRVADPETGDVPQSAVPRCPRCGGPVFANVNGGSWFLRSRHTAAAERLLRWLDAGAAPGAPPTLIVEVGVGFNTPGVTRLPMEALTREVPACALVRVNPDAEAVPGDLAGAGRALGVARGNDAVAEIVSGGPAAGGAAVTVPAAAGGVAAETGSGARRPPSTTWRRFFEGLTELAD